MDEFLKSVTVLRSNCYVWKEKVIFDLYPFGESIHLAAIESISENGYASPALDWIISLAEKHHVQIDGTIKRIGKNGLTHGQLRSWYARHGFKVSHNKHIRYLPKP